jgi:hypothetical protein
MRTKAQASSVYIYTAEYGLKTLINPLTPDDL